MCFLSSAPAQINPKQCNHVIRTIIKSLFYLNQFPIMNFIAAPSISNDNKMKYPQLVKTTTKELSLRTYNGFPNIADTIESFFISSMN